MPAVHEDGLHHDVAKFRDSPFAGKIGGLRLLQALVNTKGALLFVDGEVFVAARERQTGSLAHDRHTMDFDIEVQVLHHAFDEEHLLVILLAKIGMVRPGNEEKLGDDGQNTAEMSRAVSAAVQAFEGLVAYHGKRVTGRIHLLHARCKDKVGSQGFGEFRVGLEALGVLVQILVLAELDRIQKYTDNRNITILHRFPDKRCVTFVQSAHRGDETDCFILSRNLSECLAKSID